MTKDLVTKGIPSINSNKQPKSTTRDDLTPKGVEQYAIRAFDAVPITLAENSGLPPNDSIQQVFCFFLSLDIRQESDRYTDVMDANKQLRD